jgi:hypothetical protein
MSSPADISGKTLDYFLNFRVEGALPFIKSNGDICVGLLPDKVQARRFSPLLIECAFGMDFQAELVGEITEQIVRHRDFLSFHDATKFSV